MNAVKAALAASAAPAFVWRVSLDAGYTMRSGLVMSIVLLLFGCATTNGDGRWYNNLYKRDYETPMEKYYSRDFLICLNLVLDAPKTNQAAANSAEQQTHDCLRKGGWFWDAPA